MSAAPVFDQNPRLTQLMGRINELAVLPHVVYRVLDLSGSADSSALEMERAIVVDPGFSSRLLGIANSAYYGLPRKVTSIKEALLFLGFKAVRQLAMTVGVYDMFVGKTDKDSLRRRAWWRHSVDTAVCARWLAGQTKTMSPDAAYTAGLLHYIGKSLLDRFGEEDYSKIEFLMLNGGRDIDCERVLFGCDHVELGMRAGKKWGFPDELVGSLDYVSEPVPDEPYLKSRATIAIASQIATLALQGANEERSEETELVAWACESLELPPNKIQEFIEGGCRAIQAAAQLPI